MLCISFKLFIEILTKQQGAVGLGEVSRCVYPSNCSLKSWQSNRSFLIYSLLSVVYILQIVHWNPDKATDGFWCLVQEWLCISFKLFIEILTKQPATMQPFASTRCVYPSNCSLKSWQSNRKADCLAPKVLCISFKLFIEILTKQQRRILSAVSTSCVYPSNCSLKSWQSNLSFDSLQIVFVVYILQIVHWNPDKATITKINYNMPKLCISFKLFIEILTKQRGDELPTRWHGCVYPSNCSLKSWQSNHQPTRRRQPRVVYILQIVHWNPDKATWCLIQYQGKWLCISFKLFIEILTKQLGNGKDDDGDGCVYPSNCSLKSWQSNLLCVFRWLSMTYKESQD